MNRFVSLTRLAAACATLALLAASGAHAQTVIVSNLAAADNPGGGDNFQTVAGSNGQIGQAFNTGNSAYRLSSVILSLYNNAPLTSRSVGLSLFTNSNDLPGTSILSLGSQSVTTTAPGNYTYTSSGTTTLTANTTYWLVATGLSGNVFFNTVDPANATLKTGPGALGAYSNSSGGSFVAANTTLPSDTANYDPYKFAVNGFAVAVPEAGTLALLGACLLPIAGIVTRRRSH